MAEFLLELYVPRLAQGAEEHTTQRLRRAAEELTREGIRIQHLSSFFVPEDEICFHIYEADSIESVQMAAERAAVRFERVAEVSTESKGGPR